MISYQATDWARHLGTIEYEHATLTSSAIQLCPFELDTGRKERYKRYYDQKRREVAFEAGDYVYLDTRNTALKHAAQHALLKKVKLAARKIGPFHLERMVNPNVTKLALPPAMKKVNPTFNVEFLTPFVAKPDRFRHPPIPKGTPVIIDETGEEQHVVERLMSSIDSLSGLSSGTAFRTARTRGSARSPSSAFRIGVHCSRISASANANSSPG
ncbi:TPA: hypothetical protein N0F65_011099 [Lagenidium giganteum]|uniref:Tf2-1-like SH3-like domain-containing protein n=1 Tax=Lagenidium giganteum TaxID=4803 RepID=A0AAV2ZE97_9STRA|nr:TPA: hypothetical protein N0F65_011099 [Lagenidium giganteum]